jgi:hypothetical protein
MYIPFVLLAACGATSEQHFGAWRQQIALAKQAAPAACA